MAADAPERGIAVSAFRGLKAARSEAWAPWADRTRRWRPDAAAVSATEARWPGHNEDIRGGLVYTFAARLDFLPGTYAGPSGRRGYVAWLRRLAGITGRDTGPRPWRAVAGLTGPFAELFAFDADAGVISGRVAAKLAGDFALWRFRAAAAAADDLDTSFIVLFGAWADAFALAADRGAVLFRPEAAPAPAGPRRSGRREA